MNKAKKPKITFRQKKQIACPICKHVFYREELLTGRGRLIAGDLTEELRITYQHSKKYDRIYPLIYSIVVCPKCFYASFAADFNIPIRNMLANLTSNMSYRVSTINQLFPGINFDEDRTLSHGIASYMLALISYSFFDKKYAPSLKRAICSIRVAWCINDLLGIDDTLIKDILPNASSYFAKEKLPFLKSLFYKKAAFFYKQSVENVQKGQEIADNVRHYGPDVDKNFGYYGMLYMASLINFRLGYLSDDMDVQIETLQSSKRMLSKLFGRGQADREKPSAMLNFAKDLFSEINAKLKELNFEDK